MGLLSFCWESHQLTTFKRGESKWENCDIFASQQGKGSHCKCENNILPLSSQLSDNYLMNIVEEFVFIFSSLGLKFAFFFQISGLWNEKKRKNPSSNPIVLKRKRSAQLSLEGKFLSLRKLLKLKSICHPQKEQNWQKCSMSLSNK